MTDEEKQAEGMTVFFRFDPAKIGGNPFHVDTPFGRPATVSRGNEFERADALQARLDALVEAGERLRSGMNGHYVNAEDRYVFDGALDAAKEQSHD